MSYFGTLIWTVGGAKRLFSPKKRRNALKLGRFLRDHLGIDMARLCSLLTREQEGRMALHKNLGETYDK